MGADLLALPTTPTNLLQAPWQESFSWFCPPPASEAISGELKVFTATGTVSTATGLRTSASRCCMKLYTLQYSFMQHCFGPRTSLPHALAKPRQLMPFDHQHVILHAPLTCVLVQDFWQRTHYNFTPDNGEVVDSMSGM